MPTCSHCHYRFKTLEDELDMHECPRCGYFPSGHLCEECGEECDCGDRSICRHCEACIDHLLSEKESEQ